MPLTPFHLGPALLVGLLAFRRLDFPTFVVASVIVDVRVVLVVAGILGGPTHGPLHTFAGGGALALLLAGATYPLRPRLDGLLERLRLPQPRSAGGILAAAVVGVWLHVGLDAILYTDVLPFAPVTEVNPFLGLVPGWTVYGGCMVAGVLGLGLYAADALGYVTLSTGGECRPQSAASDSPERTRR